MAKTYELQPDIFGEHVPEISQRLDDNIYFRSGAIISEPVPTPLIFTTTHSAKNPPAGLHGRVVPIMSDSFIKALQDAGASNLQCFPAELKSSVDGSIWTNYKAVNVIGKISCANLESSEFTHIIDVPGTNALGLMGFEDLKVDSARVGGALLFRLAESPGVILVAESVVEYLRSIQSDEGWGVTIDER